MLRPQGQRSGQGTERAPGALADWGERRLPPPGSSSEKRNLPRYRFIT